MKKYGINSFLPIDIMITANPIAGKIPPATDNPVVTNVGKNFSSASTKSAPNRLITNTGTNEKLY